MHNDITFDKHTDRNIYPFISGNGQINRQFTDAVDDMVLWIPKTYSLPISATAAIGELGRLVIYFKDSNDNTVSSASYDRSAILATNGVLSGYLIWNRDAATALESSLIANNPQPQVVMYVSPSACSYIDIPSLSSIYVNGINAGYSIISDNNDSSIVIETSHSGAKRIDLYENDYGNNTPITGILFPGIKPEHTKSFSNINNNVLLRSEAECDVRVVTEDSITITEISNDKL